jgi:hypothetical protein
MHESTQGRKFSLTNGFRAVVEFFVVLMSNAVEMLVEARQLPKSATAERALKSSA